MLNGRITVESVVGKGSKFTLSIPYSYNINALKDKIFRMGTLGFVSERDLITAVGSLEAVLLKLGHKFEVGAGIKAVLESL